MDALGLTYFGTLDDVVLKYPWRFKVDANCGADSLTGMMIGASSGVFVAYMVAHFETRAADMLVRKYRLFVHDKVVPLAKLEESRRQVENIKRRRMPSTLELDRDAAQAMTRQMRRFEPS